MDASTVEGCGITGNVTVAEIGDRCTVGADTCAVLSGIAGYHCGAEVGIRLGNSDASALVQCGVQGDGGILNDRHCLPRDIHSPTPLSGIAGDDTVPDDGA